MQAEAQWWGRRHRCNSGPGPLMLHFGLQVRVSAALGDQTVPGGEKFSGP